MPNMRFVADNIRSLTHTASTKLTGFYRAKGVILVVNWTIRCLSGYKTLSRSETRMLPHRPRRKQHRPHTPKSWTTCLPFVLKMAPAKARIWPGLSHLFQDRSTGASPPRSRCHPFMYNRLRAPRRRPRRKRRRQLTPKSWTTCPTCASSRRGPPSPPPALSGTEQTVVTAV